ncbi:MAG: helix-turn-helix domain-containing protein [Bifidobacteriaceae bacterium]|jgi:excisionase family DNA binding protein|nr:helix-turn-helix domain-containing protein [Bifidobacteriaceae bacterium]
MNAAARSAIVHAADAVPGLEPFLGASELASYLGVPLSTLYDWRLHGKGPVAHRFGKHLKFALGDVHAWVAAQREPIPTEANPEAAL